MFRHSVTIEVLFFQTDLVTRAALIGHMYKFNLGSYDIEPYYRLLLQSCDVSICVLDSLILENIIENISVSLCSRLCTVVYMTRNDYLCSVLITNQSYCFGSE